MIDFVDNHFPFGLLEMLGIDILSRFYYYHLI